MDSRAELVARLLVERLLKPPASLVFVGHGWSQNTNRSVRDLDWAAILDSLRHVSWGATRALEGASDPRTTLMSPLLVNRLAVDDLEEMMRIKCGWKNGSFLTEPDWDALLATFGSNLKVPPVLPLLPMSCDWVGWLMAS